MRRTYKIMRVSLSGLEVQREDSRRSVTLDAGADDEATALAVASALEIQREDWNIDSYGGDIWLYQRSAPSSGAWVPVYLLEPVSDNMNEILNATLGAHHALMLGHKKG